MERYIIWEFRVRVTMDLICGPPFYCRPAIRVCVGDNVNLSRAIADAQLTQCVNVELGLLKIAPSSSSSSSSLVICCDHIVITKSDSFRRTMKTPHDSPEWLSIYVVNKWFGRCVSIFLEIMHKIVLRCSQYVPCYNPLFNLALT